MDLQKMLEKLALSAQEALQSAMSIAGDAKSAMVEPIHMLAALLSSGEHNISSIIKRIGAEPNMLREEVEAEIARMPKVEGGGIMGMTAPSMALVQLLDKAVKIAEKLGDSYATSEHLLIALSEENDAAGKLLNNAGINKNDIEHAYEGLRGDTRVTDQQSKTEFEVLDQYGNNLTKAAREGKLDPVIGRNEEIRRTIQVLSRRTKNNPVPARPRSWRVWRSVLWLVMSLRRYKIVSSSRSICRLCWRARSIAASSKTA